MIVHPDNRAAPKRPNKIGCQLKVLHPVNLAVEAHSLNERRDIVIRHSQNNRLLLFSFTEPPSALCIISAG